MNFEKNEKLMTINEVSELLNVKVSWVRSMLFKREIPHIKVGHLVRFKREDLLRWVRSRSFDPNNNGTL